MAHYFSLMTWMRANLVSFMVHVQPFNRHFTLKPNTLSKPIIQSVKYQGQIEFSIPPPICNEDFCNLSQQNVEGFSLKECLQISVLKKGSLSR